MQPEASSHLPHAGRGASYRVGVCLPGSIAIGGQVIDCELVNLSLTGGRLKVAEDLVVGSAALLRIEELGEFPGEVIWRYNDKVGFAFSREHEGIAHRTDDKRIIRLIRKWLEARVLEIGIVTARARAE